MSWHLKHIRMITATCVCSYMSSADLLSIEFRMVGSYTKDLKKSLNSQNWGVGACTRMGACPGQYGITSTVLYWHRYIAINYVPAWRVVLHIDIILCQCVNNYPQGGMQLFSRLPRLQCAFRIASFPGPAQLSVAYSTVKRERAWYIFSRE